MGMLHFVRHGQASFGTDDYDRLSPLGAQQCRALGAWFAARGQRFDAVLRGSLRRHDESLAALAEGHGALPTAQVLPALNEYDGEGLVRALGPALPQEVQSPEGYKRHFRLLREALAKWMAGELQPAGGPSYAEWRDGIAQAMELARGSRGEVLVVSSGGTISTALGRVLGLAPPVTIELNMQMRNSAVSQVLASPRGFSLVSYNHLPHLDAPERAAWVTYT